MKRPFDVPARMSTQGSVLTFGLVVTLMLRRCSRFARVRFVTDALELEVLEQVFKSRLEAK